MQGISLCSTKFSGDNESSCYFEWWGNGVAFFSLSLDIFSGARVKGVELLATLSRDIRVEKGDVAFSFVSLLTSHVKFWRRVLRLAAV